MSEDYLSEESREDIESVMRVIRVVADEESDVDHISIIMDSFADLCRKYGESVWPDDQEPTKDDVAVALDILHKYEYEGLYEFVELGAQYTNRPLPEPREWEVVYRDSNTNEVLETREMEYADSEPTKPIINGEPYDCSHTKWDGQTFIVYVTEPEIGKFEIDCWDCDYSDTAETEAEATNLCMTHNEENEGHSAGYSRNRE